MCPPSHWLYMLACCCSAASRLSKYSRCFSRCASRPDVRGRRSTALLTTMLCVSGSYCGKNGRFNESQNWSIFRLASSRLRKPYSNRKKSTRPQFTHAPQTHARRGEWRARTHGTHRRHTAPFCAIKNRLVRRDRKWKLGRVFRNKRPQLGVREVSVMLHHACVGSSVHRSRKVGHYYPKRCTVHAYTLHAYTHTVLHAYTNTHAHEHVHAHIHLHTHSNTPTTTYIPPLSRHSMDGVLAQAHSISPKLDSSPAP